ncbi:hypothetical protein PI125_g17179 [Phytophthora idaei]|nr:hypothetical protein PI125_g17179 [Phytophthora idaei]
MSPMSHAVWTCAFPLPGREITNNMAEFERLLAWLRVAAIHTVCHLHIKGDSNHIINQVGGTYATTHPHLRVLQGPASSITPAK